MVCVIYMLRQKVVEPLTLRYCFFGKRTLLCHANAYGLKEKNILSPLGSTFQSLAPQLQLLDMLKCQSQHFPLAHPPIHGVSEV